MTIIGIRRHGRHPCPLIFFLSILNVLIVPSAVATHLRGKEEKTRTVQCRITLFHTLSWSADKGEQTFFDTVCIPLVHGEEGHEATVYNIDLPDIVWHRHAGQIEEGRLHLEITHAQLRGDNKVSTTDKSEFIAHKQENSRRRRLSKPFNQTIGTRSLAIVTVSTTSGQRVSHSEETLRKRLFEDPVGMAGQYYSCSLGLLKWTSAGFYQIELEGSIADYGSPSEGRNAALKQLVRNGIVKESAQELADNVMVILPHGTMGLVANAGVNYWLSTFNDAWSLDLLTSIHELGK